ncbi:MAG: putative quinol monooxygenase [Enterococcus sp.]
MLLVNATFTIRPETKAEFLTEINELISSSQNETGCLAYELYQSLATANQFVMIEQWADNAALAQHNQNPLLQQFAQNLPHYVTQKPVILVSETK